MTDRELFNRIMHYDEFDRMPVCHWGVWPETRERWRAEGMPADADENEFLGASTVKDTVGVYLGLLPPFEEELLEETDDWRVVRGGDGVVSRTWKHRSGIPQYIDFTLKGREGWDEYSSRLRPDPARIPPDLDERIERAKTSEVPVAVDTGSMIGRLRDWMGVENLAYLCHDDRELLAEMVMTMADLVCWGLDQILPKFTPDLGGCWEDICFRSGPLISPDIFGEVAVPGYRKISDKLRDCGCDLHFVDCDGMIDALVPHWLEAGVNIMFPFEIGVWKADPAKLRKKYGRELRIYGGIDKLEIPYGPAAIDREIARRVPLMKEGGYVPLPDHAIVPDTSLENYRYYLDAIRSLRF